MQYTTNYSLKKPQYADEADIEVINDNTDDVDTLIHQNRTMIAPAFDNTKAYVTGDPVEYLGALYVFTADKAAGAWDASKVEPTTAAEMGGGGASALADLDDVEITSPAQGQALVYDDTDDIWKNATLPEPVDVEANPSASSTATLSKLKVGSTVYGVSGLPSTSSASNGDVLTLGSGKTPTWAAPAIGGDGVTIDTSTVITSGNIAEYGALNYTATQDCFVAFLVNPKSGYTTYIKINNVTIKSFYGNFGNSDGLPYEDCIFLKTGQALYVNNNANYTGNYHVYGVQEINSAVVTQLNAMKTGFDGVTYASPAAMVQGEDQKLQNEITSVDNSKNTLLADNVMSYTDEIDVTGSSTYQRSATFSFPATPGVRYTLKIDSVTGNKDSVVGVLRTKDSNDTVVNTGNLTATTKSISLTASAGSVTVEFYLAGSNGTSMAGDTAVFKGILLVTGTNSKIHLRNDVEIERLNSAESNITELQGDMSEAKNDINIINGDLSKIISTNIIQQYGDISVTGTSSYTQYIIDITDFTVGLRYNIISDRVVGNKDSNKFMGRLFSGETIEKTEYSSGNGVAVTPTSNTTKIRFILTASNGTSMAGDTAVYYNTRIYTGAQGSEYYRVGYAETAGAVEQVSETTLLRSMKLQTVKSVAHRGKMDEAPMCTAPAYIAARMHLCDWGENDLNVTSDGKWVMWHDDTLYRLGTYVKDIHGYDLYKLDSTYYWVNGTTVYDLDYEVVSVSVSSLTHVASNTVSITSTSYDLLKNVDFGSWFSSDFAGTKILTLKEWLILCKGLGLGVYIHFKSAFTAEQIQEIIGIVKTCGMLENAVFLVASSTVASIREYAPYNRIGIVWYADDSLINSLRQYLVPSVPNSIFFDPNISDLTTARHEKAKNNGFGSECYYVEWASGTTEETIFQTIQNAVDMGVDGITLNKYRVDEAMFSKYFSE